MEEKTEDKKKLEELSFEQAYEKLQAIVNKLENENNGLEASLKLYQEGKQLSDHCRALLDRSEAVLKTIQEAQL